MSNLVRNMLQDAITAVDDEDYHAFVVETCAANQRVLDAGDTAVCPDSYEAARFAAGGAICAARAVADGDATRSFAAVRPPGHHAEADRAMGF